MSVTIPVTEPLPSWTQEAVQLLKSALGVMAQPVIVNNLKRVAADPAHPTPQELEVYLEKVRHGIRTFAASARADALVDQLRVLLRIPGTPAARPVAAPAIGVAFRSTSGH